MAGYIKLYRDIQTHWLWADKPFSKGQAWIDLLMMANHEEVKTIIRNEIITIERGCLITSEVKLAERWGWSRTKIREFLNLLKRDQMIDKKSDNKKTWIKILNYDIWQNSETAKIQQIEQQKNSKKTAEKQQKNTNNNNKNVKNDKNINNIYNVIFDHWNSKKIIVHKKLTDEFKKDIDKALKQSSLEEIIKAIDHYAEAYHDPKYEYCKYKWGIHEFLTRKEGYKRFLDDGAKWLNYLRFKNSQRQDKPKSRYREE